MQVSKNPPKPYKIFLHYPTARKGPEAAIVTLQRAVVTIIARTKTPFAFKCCLKDLSETSEFSRYDGATDKVRNTVTGFDPLKLLMARANNL